MTHVAIIENCLHEDFEGAELKWVLFCSALCSYKKESLLRPFPPLFKRGNEKDFDSLLSCCRSMPSLRNLSTELLSEQQASLLSWVLDSRTFHVKSVSPQKFEELKLSAKMQPSSSTRTPDYLFEITYCESLAQRFEQRRSDLPLLCAFHGSKLPHFHSICHHGLVTNLNKNSLFGQGTYLSKELSVSLNWSPSSTPGFVRCSFGDRLSCVAFCEVIQDPTGIKYDSAPSNSRRWFYGGVPDSYFVVQNDALVRVKYLLLYAERNFPVWSLGRATQNWVRQNPFWLCLLIYAFMLLCVGVANSRKFRFYINRWTEYYWSPHSYEET